MEVKGFPDYLIYPDGRVWSKKRKIFLKPHTDINGYMFNRLCNDGKATAFKVHRLVAVHYIPNPENKKTIDHINRDKTNNNVENLRWATSKEQRKNQREYKIYRNNTSGYKNISFCKGKNTWRFSSKKTKINRYFHSKIDCICYKFIFNLMSACNIR